MWAVLRKAPPLPFLPADVHGKEVVVLAVFYTGDATYGEAHIDALRAFGPRVGEHVGLVPYAAWQQAFDPLLAPGARNYWKSHNFTELADGAIDALAAYAGGLPSDHCEIFVALVSGAANRVPAGAMAYPNRDTRLVVNVHARWEDAASDQACIGWARNFYALGGAVRLGRGLRQLHDGRRSGASPVGLRRQLPAARGAEAAVRSRQRLPHQPEHRAVDFATARVNLAGGSSVISWTGTPRSGVRLPQGRPR